METQIKEENEQYIIFYLPIQFTWKCKYFVEKFECKKFIYLSQLK